MRRQFVAILVLAWAAVGCGGPDSCTVSGQVKLDGKPVEKGTITFTSSDAQGTTVTGDIVGGKYSVRTTPGPKAVQISAPVVTGKKPESSAPDAAMVEITAETVPAKYNSQTELKFDAASGSNAKDFDLVGGIPVKK